MGNPSTGESFYDVNYRVPYAHGVGIISDQIYEVVYLISGTKFMCYNLQLQEPTHHLIPPLFFFSPFSTSVDTEKLQRRRLYKPKQCLMR